jgi:hypothetical protein
LKLLSQFKFKARISSQMAKINIWPKLLLLKVITKQRRRVRRKESPLNREKPLEPTSRRDSMD